MLTQKFERVVPFLAVAFAAVILFPAGCKRKTITDANSVGQEAATPLTLQKIINQTAKKDWLLVGGEYYGKTCPDFSLTDLTGKEHKLYSYKGKNVLVIIWADWCPSCRAEIPAVIELRKNISEQELAIISIAVKTDAKKIKQFIEDKKINYPVIITDIKSIPEPFNINEYIPCTYFLDSQGRLKIAIEGELTFKDMKQIIEAKF